MSENQVVPASSQPQSAVQPQRAQLSILIVDDDAGNQKLMHAVLETEGHTIFDAADGAEALSVLSHRKIDVIVSEILMPKMDGYSLCYELRKDARFKAIPLIICSNTYVSASDKRLALDLGVSAFLAKPLSPSALGDAIQAALTGKAPIRAKMESPEELEVIREYSHRLIKTIEEDRIELSRRTEQLRASEERFRQIAENIHEVFWIASPDMGKLIYVSPAYEDIWGCTCKSLCEKPESWFDSIHSEDRTQARAAVRGEHGFSVEYRILRPDGELRWILARGWPVRDKAGQVYRMAGIATDITERKQAEETLQKTEAQLRQVQKMEAVGQLAGGVAHDFNNLLTVIMGRTELMMSRVKPDERMWHELELVHKTGARAAALTRQLLAFSRQQVLQPVVLDLNAVVSEIGKMLRRMLGEDIGLVTVLEPKLRMVKADPTQVEQVLMNLAVNARDAMPGGGKLTIETSNTRLDESYCRSHPNVKPGHYVLLAVSDTGCGMDAETQSHIFEPFFTTKEQGKGTGLGLSTVYGIVKQSGGNTEVYSELKKGTTFKIYLPFAEGVPQPLLSGEGLPAVRGGQETILVVEDEESVRELVGEMLGPHGYTVLMARSGREALQTCKQYEGPIHLLLTDVVMPEMSGLQLAQDLGRRRPLLKVLFMSGYATHAAANHSILEPGADYIQKPFTPGKLGRKVRQVLDGVQSTLLASGS